MKNNCKGKNLFSINNENEEQRLDLLTNYSIVEMIYKLGSQIFLVRTSKLDVLTNSGNKKAFLNRKSFSNKQFAARKCSIKLKIWATKKPFSIGKAFQITNVQLKLKNLVS